MSDYSHLTPQNAKIVTVDWEDIVFSDKWSGDEEDTQPVEVITLGWLLEETPTMLVVAGSYNYREEQWATVHSFSKKAPAITVIRGGEEKQWRE